MGCRDQELNPGLSYIKPDLASTLITVLCCTAQNLHWSVQWLSTQQKTSIVTDPGRLSRIQDQKSTDLGSQIRNKKLIIYPSRIPDTGVKKAGNLGYGYCVPVPVNRYYLYSNKLDPNKHWWRLTVCKCPYLPTVLIIRAIFNKPEWIAWSRMNCGTWVVFPQPVSPDTTNTCR